MTNSYETIERIPLVASASDRKENLDCCSTTKIAAVLMLAVTGAAALVRGRAVARVTRGRSERDVCLVSGERENDRRNVFPRAR